MASLPALIQKLYDFIFFSNIPWGDRIIVYVLGAGLALGALLFRKNVANDVLNMAFSPTASIFFGELGLVVSYHFLNLRYSFGIGLVLMFAAGFLMANFLGEGEAD